MKNKGTVYVFGGAGFIGCHVINYLLSSDRFSRIICVDKTLVKIDDNLKGVTYYQADVTQELTLEPGAKNDLIINLVGLRTFPGFPDEDYFKTNVESSKVILDFARRSGILNIIFTSTMAVYPTGPQPKSESSILCPESAYGESKQRAEGLHKIWSTESDQSCLVICRPAVIFGLFDNGNFTRLSRAIKYGMFVYAGRKDTIKSSGYVKDLVASFFFALDRAGEGKAVTYNFAFPDRVTIKQTAETISVVGRYYRPRFTMPAKLLKVCAYLFEMLNVIGIKNGVSRARIEKLYHDTNIVPQWLIDNEFTWTYDLDQAINDWHSDCNGENFY